MSACRWPRCGARSRGRWWPQRRLGTRHRRSCMRDVGRAGPDGRHGTGGTGPWHRLARAGRTTRRSVSGSGVPSSESMIPRATNGSSSVPTSAAYSERYDVSTWPWAMESAGPSSRSNSPKVRSSALPPNRSRRSLPALVLYRRHLSPSAAADRHSRWGKRSVGDLEAASRLEHPPLRDTRKCRRKSGRPSSRAAFLRRRPRSGGRRPRSPGTARTTRLAAGTPSSPRRAIPLPLRTNHASSRAEWKCSSVLCVSGGISSCASTSLSEPISRTSRVA